MKSIRKITWQAFGCTCVLTPLLLASCGSDKPEEKTAAKAGTQEAVIPATYFLAERPTDVPMLCEVKAGSQVGDMVRFEARVGGRAEPFVDGIAIFLTADPRLVSCDQRPGDHCPVPYDYCCEDADAMMAGTATIQMVDASGSLYPISANGQGGIEPLQTLVIEGVVSEKDANGVFVVDASKIWVGSIPSTPVADDGQDKG